MILLIDCVAFGAAIFALVTLVLYFVIFFIVLRDKKNTFGTTFYKMFVLLTLSDMIAILNNFFGASLPAWQVYDPTTNEVVSYIHQKVFLSITWFCRYNQGFGVLVMSANRATALWSPANHLSIWKGRWKYSMLLQFLPGFAVGLLVSSMEGTYKVFEDREIRHLLTIFANHDQRKLLYRISYIVEGVKIIGLFITNGFFLYSYIKRSNRRVPLRSEKSAAHMVYCLCGVEFIFLTYTGAMVLFVPVPSPTTTSLNSTFTDFYSSINCYIALGFNRVLRRQIIAPSGRRATIVGENPHMRSGVGAATLPEK